MAKKKRSTMTQKLRKSKAQTKGADARVRNVIERVLPIIRRSKVDKPLTASELQTIKTLRDMLTTRLEIAAFDSALHEFQESYPDELKVKP